LPENDPAKWSSGFRVELNKEKTNNLSQRTIELRNVSVNNLKNIDLDIPHGQWLSICGLSGSGKSSLAFDTLYAEGQRRYLECLSPGTRKMVTQRNKPDADRINGLPPAIAVTAIKGTPDRRTTVGNATEVVEYLRLLFAQIGEVVCPVCQTHVKRSDAQGVANRLAGLPSATRYMIAFRTEAGPELIGNVLANGRRNGFLRAIVAHRMLNLDSQLDRFTPAVGVDKVFLIVDRLAVGASDHSRVVESLETAFQFGFGDCEIFVANQSASEMETGIDYPVDGNSFQQFSYSSRLICSTCQRLFPLAEPKLFSFNRTASACSQCQGSGFQDDRLEDVCTLCQGERLADDALAFQVGGKNIAGICRLKIDDAVAFFRDLNLSAGHQLVARTMLKEIQSRLGYLQSVRLGYLTLDRPVRTLSSGETQRVSLTSCLSSTLVNMLYVLDEPSMGLHPHDVGRLIEAIGQLNRRGNTLIVVDHEEELIRAAPRIVEIGPAAGAAGGEIVFDGELNDLINTSETTTADFLAGRRGVSCGAETRRQPRGRLQLTGACGHNLKNISVEFPLGCLCVVSGVSGAGKSTLIGQTLYGAICQRQGKSGVPALPFDEMFGGSQVDEVVMVDQSPIGRTARSNPVTYVKAFDEIRQTFAETADAKTQNIKAGHFSFNVTGGRCDKCSGEGQLTIDMQFLSDVYIRCDQCNGTRFNDRTLSVRYRGLSIADVLNLTVREAFTFFRGQPKVQTKLKALIDVGLEYIRLGQPATTLSAGEAQRLKLAVYLNAPQKKRVLFLLEEPTTGLHMADVTRLLDCFETLVAGGHSLIVVEHSLQLMKHAGAAEAGGEVVVAGTPEQVADCPASVTGKFLATELAKGK
jgi:excinuclease ABC subunit A